MADPVEIDPQVLARVRRDYSPFKDTVESLGLPDLVHRGIMFVSDPVVGAITGTAKTIFHGGSLGDNIHDSIAAQRADSAEVLKAEKFLRDESPIASYAGTGVGFVAGLFLGTTEGEVIVGGGVLLAKGGAALAERGAVKVVTKVGAGVQEAKMIDQGNMAWGMSQAEDLGTPITRAASGTTKTVEGEAAALAAAAPAAPGVGAAPAAAAASPGLRAKAFNFLMGTPTRAITTIATLSGSAGIGGFFEGVFSKGAEHVGTMYAEPCDTPAMGREKYENLLTLNPLTWANPLAYLAKFGGEAQFLEGHQTQVADSRRKLYLSGETTDDFCAKEKRYIEERRRQNLGDLLKPPLASTPDISSAGQPRCDAGKNYVAGACRPVGP
jgi:hypothetical protein